MVSLPAKNCPKCNADMRTGFGGEDTSQLSPFKLFNFVMRTIIIILLVVFTAREMYMIHNDRDEALLWPKVKEHVSYEITNLGRMIRMPGARIPKPPPAPPKPNNLQVLSQEYPLLFRPDIIISELGRTMDKEESKKSQAVPSWMPSCLLPKAEEYRNPGGLSACQKAIVIVWK